MEVNRYFTTVRSALMKVGITGRPVLYDLGEPQTAERIRELTNRAGLRAEELSSWAGIPQTFSRLDSTAGGSNHWWASRRVDSLTALKIISWRDEALKSFGRPLPKSSGSARQHRHNRSEILKTLIPNLGNRYSLLHAVLRQVRQFLRISGANITGLQDHLCEQAYMEISGRSREQIFTKFLPWAPQLMPFLEQNLQRIQQPGDLAPIAHEAIGARFGLSARIILVATWARTSTIPPGEMRGLILGLHVQPQEKQRVASLPAESGKTFGGVPGRKPGPRRMSPEKTNAFSIGKKVQDAIPRIKTICERIGSLPKRARRNRTKVAALLAGFDYTENEITAAMGNPGTPMVAARNFVSFETRHSYDTVGKYHRLFLHNGPQV